MTNWRNIVLAALLVGLMAFGALAATEQLRNQDRVCACDGDETCLMEGEQRQVQTREMKELRQELRTEQLAERLQADGTGPHGQGDNRQTRRGTPA